MAKAKQDRSVVTASGAATEKSLREMSEQMHGHAIATALRAGTGHAVGSVSGNSAPDNDCVLQKGSVVPQRIFAGPSQASQGGFQQGGAAGADYETCSTGDTPDADSTGPTGL
jgi:hypothetical protein